MPYIDKKMHMGFWCCMIGIPPSIQIQTYPSKRAAQEFLHYNQGPWCLCRPTDLSEAFKKEDDTVPVSGKLHMSHSVLATFGSSPSLPS